MKIDMHLLKRTKENLIKQDTITTSFCVLNRINSFFRMNHWKPYRLMEAD